MKSVCFYMDSVKIPAFVGKITIKLAGAQTMANFARLLTYTEIHLKSGDWNAYNDMNEKIIRCMRGQSI